MKNFILHILLMTAIFLTASVHAVSQTIDLDVNGISITSSYETVIEKLGKPRSEKKGGIVPCQEGRTLVTLRYPGLVLKLDNNDEGKDFGVFEVEVTSKKWLVNGTRIGTSKDDVNADSYSSLNTQPIQIGASKDAVIAKFGPGRELEDNGKPFLGYFIDGYARFYFKNDRLTKIIWEFNFC